MQMYNHHSFLFGMCGDSSYAGRFSGRPLGSENTTKGNMRPDGNQKRRKESKERLEQTNKPNLVKPSAGLGPGLERMCAYTRSNVNRVLGIRTDPGLSNSQLADDPILEHSAAQRTSRHGTPPCVPASAGL
ncbi:hypothetical protein CHARACLAT_024547 [Characodon lateralis]|uniref:Uncharacterized protein n=1 Tax=Characodon lateralis TaxID=208331 RepID=A0ABU7EWH5_9TELE|nr:hypothetical protein [Characodon lateralis]